MYSYRVLLQAITVALSIACCASGQIAQDKPELCGMPDRNVPLPAGIMAVRGDDGIVSTLLLKTGASPDPISLQLTMGSVEEVCPISGNRLLTFGDSNPAASVAIVDREAARLVDEFFVYDPAVSPNQHWIAFRDFYPPQSELAASEEYLLYDLTKNKAANRLSNPKSYLETVGRVIYPSVKDGIPFMHAGLPDAQTHSFDSRSFFWADDSKTVVFGDGSQNGLWVVLVTLNETEPHALVHRVINREACEQESQGDVHAAGLMVIDATFGKGQNANRSIELRFQSSDYGACRPKELILYPSDFVEATPETHATIQYKKQPVLKQ